MAGLGSSFGHYMLSSMSRGKFVNILHSTCIFGYMQGNMKASEAKLLDDRQLICSHFRYLCMQMDPNPPFWNLNAYMRITLKKHPIVPLKSIIRDNLHLPLLLPRIFFQSSIFVKILHPPFCGCMQALNAEACWMSVVLFTISGTFAFLRIWNLNVCILIIRIRRYKVSNIHYHRHPQ